MKVEPLSTEEIREGILPKAIRHGTNIQAVVALVAILATATTNYAIMRYQVADLEVKMQKSEDARVSSMAQWDTWKLQQEGRLSQVEAHQADETASLTRIESKLDRVIERVAK